jgi:hypothetical protein
MVLVSSPSSQPAKGNVVAVNSSPGGYSLISVGGTRKLTIEAGIYNIVGDPCTLSFWLELILEKFGFTA